MEFSTNDNLPISTMTGSSYTTDDMVAMETVSLQERAHSIQRVTFLYIGPVLGVICMTSNVIASFCFWPRAKKSSTFNYLFVASMFDNVLIATHVLFYGLLVGPGIDLRQYLTCSVINIGYFVPSHLSVWFVCLCCIERSIIISHPTRAKAWFSPRRARIAMVVVAIGIVTINWHLFGALKTVPMDSENIMSVCTGRLDILDAYHKQIYPFIDIIMYAIAPTIILFIVNTLNIRQFLKARSQVAPLNVSQNTMSKVSLRLTMLASSLSTIFILLTVPVCTVFILLSGAENFEFSTDTIVKLQIAGSVLELFVLLNHGCTLYVCLILSKSFRKDVKKLFTQGVLGGSVSSEAGGEQIAMSPR